MTETILASGYNVLRAEVSRLLQEGKARAVAAVERETLRTYHGIGRVVSEYLLAHPASYGEQTVTRLAADAGLSKSTLYEAVAFHRFRPNFHTRGNLGWTHYRALLRLPTDADRDAAEAAAATHRWSVRELEAQIRSGGIAPVAGPAPEVAPSQPLAALRGQFYTYRLVEGSELGDSGLRLDLGFGIQLAWPIPQVGTYHAGQFLSATREAPEAYRFDDVTGRTTAFYTYQAQVLKVIDGDTVWLDIDCGFRVWTRQKVRLRGIDTPEIKTAEGVRARDFVVEALQGLSSVAVTTTKLDKYDRYLADLFYLVGEEDREVALREGRFLNRELVKAGLARRV